MVFCKRKAVKGRALLWYAAVFVMVCAPVNTNAMESQEGRDTIGQYEDGFQVQLEETGGPENEKPELSEAIPENIEEDMEKYLDITKIQNEFSKFSESESFSFAETVRGLLRGEIPFSINELMGMISDLFLAELRRQKNMALQILVIVLASAVFSNFVKIFESSQIADISFYMMYLLVSTLLVKSFLSMSQIVAQTCGAMNSFMKVLLPSYLVTVVFSSGTVSALGFYEITVMGMNLLQILIVKMVLPAINFFLVLLILNQVSKEDYFSKFAELTETIIGWTVKTIMGVVIGFQAVQCLIAPAVDSLKNSAMHRLAKAIPGIGSVIDSAAETVAGSAVVIKNAVGVAGILALAVLCVLPLVKLAACILIFRLLCALIQPFSEKRMVECVGSISRGAVLLLRVLVAGLSIFVISLAMVTASVRGG